MRLSDECVEKFDRVEEGALWTRRRGLATVAMMRCIILRSNAESIA